MAANPRPAPLICGVDDSRQARNAVRFAAELADALATSVVLAHVTEVPIIAGYGVTRSAYPALERVAQTDAEALLARVAEETGCLEAPRRVEFGRPSERLAALASSEGARMLVVGSRGQGKLRGALLGSVSAELCGRAPCPVVVVPGTDLPAPAEAGEPPSSS